jgi:hypothetical protein
MIKFFLASCMLLTFNAHKFYVSNTHIVFNQPASTLEITVKIFTDDLELALENRYIEPMRLGDEREHDMADEWIEEYLLEKMQIDVDNKPVTLKYLGKEVELDLTYCYLEVPLVTDFHQMAVTNKLLFEEFDEQANIIDISTPLWQEKMLLVKGQPRQYFER